MFLATITNILINCPFQNAFVKMFSTKMQAKHAGPSQSLGHWKGTAPHLHSSATGLGEHRTGGLLSVLQAECSLFQQAGYQGWTTRQKDVTAPPPHLCPIAVQLLAQPADTATLKKSVQRDTLKNVVDESK